MILKPFKSSVLIHSSIIPSDVGELQREINDYKRTIFNLEADASKQKQ